MKKLFAFSLAFIFMLFGCVPENPPTPQLEFTAEISVSGDNISLAGEISSTKEGAVFISISTPDEISGLSYSFRDEASMSFFGLEMKSSESYLPRENFALAIKNLLSDLSKNVEFKEYQEGLAVFEGTCESGKYSAFTDTKGYIQNISLKEINLSVIFEYEH